ncbi:MAG TPA: ORF6N domain-containing protein [Bacteroidales bacterium]|nr:ORF6N domain-containing protein [Bacteroidales bacterium]
MTTSHASLQKLLLFYFPCFPEHFMFELTKKEKDELVANCDRFKNLKHSTSLPRAFTEYGVLQAANVLSSERAVNV